MLGTVLDPRGDWAGIDKDRGPDAGPLQGKRVGLRRDEFWESWDWVTDEWATALRAQGAEPVIWRAPVVKGEKVAAGSDDFQHFLDSIDVAIVGLCNCGSCTLWAVHDALASLDRGLATVLVATDHFVRLARTLADKGNRPDIRMAVLPYPLEGQPEASVRQTARDAFDQVLDALGAVR